jgi:hypothetical protein
MLHDPFKIESVELKIEPIVRVSQTDLNSLMSTLEVNVVALSECVATLHVAAAGSGGIH